MRVLLTRSAFDRFSRILLDGIPPEVEWLCIGDGGTLTDAAGAPAHSDGVSVAWASTDLLYGDARAPFVNIVETSATMRWLQSGYAGLDFPVYRPLLERGAVVTTSHVNAVAIAEYVLGAVLRHYQRPDEWADAQRRTEWRHHEFRELYASRWLVIGVGAIGSAVAARARAFGAHVDGVRRTPSGAEPVDRMLTPADIPEALPRADVVVLALPATRDTTALVDAAFLARMRPGSVLVNIARGSLVDEDALVRALDSGPLEHAILDVFDQEPLPPSSPLWRHPNITITPHASAAGLGRHERNAHLFHDNLVRFLAGEEPHGAITLAAVLAARGADAPAQFKES